MTARTRRGLQGDAAQRIGRRADTASRDDGGGASGRSTPAPARGGGILGALAAAAEEPPAEGERILTVDLAAIAPHPENVRDGMGDVSGIGASIAERGVLQPLVVVSRAAFAAARPDVELEPGVGYVILAGHRRHAGAQLACVPTVPVVVRDALAGDEDAVVSMLVENLQREDLTPTEQARAFGRLRDRGWSERSIAAETGVSAGQVHKRLSLLRLPAAVATDLDAGTLTVTDALRLLELPDDELAAAWRDAQRDTYRGVRGVVESRLAAAQGRAQAARQREQLTAAGVETITDPREEFGPDHFDHYLGSFFHVDGVESGLPDDSAPPALPDGALAHVSSHGARGNVTYYSREPRPRPTPGASGGSTPAGPAAGAAGDELQRRRDAAETAEQRRTAAAGRAQACARLVTGELDAELAAEILADTLLVDHTVEPYEVAATAAEWCGADLAALDDELGDTVDDYDGGVETAWMAREAAAGGIRARRAAVAVALAETEQLIAHPLWGTAVPDTAWPARVQRHVHRLAARAGYDLTDDDRGHLDIPAAGTADRPDRVDEGASAGSTPDPEGSPS